MSHAMPPSTSAATVTTTKAGSNSDRNPGHHGRAVDLRLRTGHRAPLLSTPHRP